MYLRSSRSSHAWLNYIRLPTTYIEYVSDPRAFPKTYNALCTLMRCQISKFPYENLSVHYSSKSVDINPDSIYAKLMGVEGNGGRRRGGYCLEVSIFFYHMLLGMGFSVYTTGVRNRKRTNGVPGGEFLGFSHINNIVHLPSGQKFSIDVGFGGDGPTSPLQLNELGQAIQNSRGNKLWIYQYRNGPTIEWNSFYCFAEQEFFQDDFEVVNWWAGAKTLHTWSVLSVRFLREGEDVKYSESPDLPLDREVKIVGKVMLVDDVIKVNLGGKTSIVHSFDSEVGRLQALKEYFGITLTEEEAQSINDSDMALK
ncbi:hypothetical protein BJX70DRAFT_391814 [Aspergillus crustosus]